MPDKQYGPTPAAPTARGISARVGRACAVLAQAERELTRAEDDALGRAGELYGVPTQRGQWELLGHCVGCVAADLRRMIAVLQEDRDRFARATGVRTRAKKGE